MKEVLEDEADPEVITEAAVEPVSLASLLRTCSNSHSCPIKLRFGDMMERLVLTNL